jgi:SET domain-containing protein
MGRGALKVKSSKIAGKGVFTDIIIKKGQTIYFLEGELCSLEEILKRIDEGKEEPSDPLGVEEEKYLDLDKLSRQFNHSCDPNSFIRGKNELVALRDIKIGNEINYDYSTTMDENEEKIKRAGRSLWTCRCNCGAENCRGTIDQFKTLPKDIQQFYIKNKFMPDFMLKKFRASKN